MLYNLTAIELHLSRTEKERKILGFKIFIDNVVILIQEVPVIELLGLVFTISLTCKI